MKAKSKKQSKSKKPTEKDVLNEAKSLQELLWLAVVVVLSLLLLLFLFWAFS
jgi:hypothetical protein